MTTKKKSLHGNLVEKQDLGKYSKTLGIEPLTVPGSKNLYATLYK